MIGAYVQRMASLLASGRARLVALDPRRVRLRDPRRPLSRPLALAVVGGVVLAGAVAVAASTRGAPPTPVAAGAGLAADVDPSSHARPTEQRSASADPAMTARRPDRATPARDPRFHDPYYVFTESPVEGVEAYPLADPPGLVVNLTGMTEPSAPAAEMVGADERLIAVRRRSTPQGLRYVLRVSTPIRRIEVTAEGNVVIIAPVR